MTRRIGATFGLIAVALLAAFWFVGWSPATSDLQKAHANATAATAQMTQLQGQVATLLAAERKAPLYRSELNQLKQAVPDDPNYPAVIDDLTKVASSSGVVISSISPSVAIGSASGTATSGPATLGLALSVTGTYPQMLNFLTGLTQQTRIFVVNSINLSAGSGAQLSASISGHVYYANAAASPGSGGAS